MGKISTRKIVIIAPILLLIPGNALAQSIPCFSQYSNNYFKIYYPTGWNVNNTMTNDTTFSSPNNTAIVVVGLRPWVVGSRIMDKDYWYNMQQPANGQNLQTITNDTNYLSGHPALMALGTRGALEELFLITKINGTMYGITYISSVANYPKDPKSGRCDDGNIPRHK